MKVWVGTDWHLVEHNTRMNCNLKSPRANEILRIYQELVNVDDIFIFLGDICCREFSNQSQLIEMIQPLKGYKVFIKGNHDIQDDAFYYKAGFDIVCEAAKLGNIIFTHKPIDIPEDADIVNVHGHLHNQRFQTFDNKHINPYGYCHGTIVELRKVLSAAKSQLIDAKEFSPSWAPRKHDDMLTMSDLAMMGAFDLTEIITNGPDGHPVDETACKARLRAEEEILNDIIFDFDDVYLASKLGRLDGKSEDNTME